MGVHAMQGFVHPGNRAPKASSLVRLERIDQALGASLDNLHSTAHAQDEKGQPNKTKQDAD
jgi:hypothetical protein